MIIELNNKSKNKAIKYTSVTVFNGIFSLKKKKKKSKQNKQTIIIYILQTIIINYGKR